MQLQHAKNSAKHIAQISLNVHRVWPMLRPCLLDGRLLHFGSIHALHIESITEHYWDSKNETWVGSFLYEERMEALTPTHVSGMQTWTKESVAVFPAIEEPNPALREQKYLQMKVECRAVQVCNDCYEKQDLHPRRKVRNNVGEACHCDDARHAYKPRQAQVQDVWSAMLSATPR